MFQVLNLNISSDKTSIQVSINKEFCSLFFEQFKKKKRSIKSIILLITWVCMCIISNNLC